MASMLRCSICSKRPKFTDVSHLLTHVGSKAHLATLHKLQIKSHDDNTAASQLDVYNQWFQQYDLARLLSERMQMKEKKQASKQARTTKKRVTKRESVPNDGNTNGVTTSVVEAPRRRGRPKKAKPAAEAVELDAPSYEDASQYPLTPLRQTWWPDLQSSPPSADSSAIDPALVTPRPANGNTKLKGKIWPGMALFDAATPEEARRRNQKKDASVVKRMERLSDMVVPNEVVFSTEWSLRKSRHIDDLDDAISLIEGESPLMLKPKPKPRGRKKVLSGVSTNIPRSAKRTAKVSPSPKRGRRARKDGPAPTIARIPSSANPTALSDPFTPVDDDEDFKLPVGNMRPKKARTEFAIHEDSPSLPSKSSQIVSLSEAYSVQAPRLTFHTAPWLQPENQNPLFFDAQPNSYRAGTLSTGLQGFAANKENMTPRVNHGESLNPLAWPSPHHQQPGAGPSLSSTFEQFPGLVAAGAVPDPFGFDRNPLADAFAQLGGEKRSVSDKPAWSPSGFIRNPLQPLVATTNNSKIRMR